MTEDKQTEAEAELAPQASRLRVKGLQILLPGGAPLIKDLSLDLLAGECVVLLGGSGSGKSTFSRVLFEEAELFSDGFAFQAEELDFTRAELGFVPQRGALFDHLNVKENLEIGHRYSADQSHPPPNIEEWLSRVGLDPDLAKRKVSRLSGGQAQRLSIARALATRREVLFLDEPSVGLDPHRVRMLAQLIHEQCQDHNVATIVVTHDLPLAVGIATRLYILDPQSKKLEHLFPDEWPGPCEGPSVSEDTRSSWIARLESEIVERIEGASAEASPAKTNATRGQSLLRRVSNTAAFGSFLRPFGVAVGALATLPKQLTKQPRDLLSVAKKVVNQTLLRPLPFYCIVSMLLGYTVLYVISKVGGAGVRPDALVRQIGGSYAVALAPALSAILFVSASGTATSAWLGSMGLTRQVVALEALGVSTKSYLWAPTWLALSLSYLVVTCVFSVGMLVGGLVLCSQYSMTGAWDLLIGDIVDPRPERLRYLLRALFLVWIYAWGMSSNLIAKASTPKRESDDVTHAMTGSVVSCTLWVVVWELLTAMMVFSE